MADSPAQNVASGEPRAGGPRVLELRVHGIKNTAPHDLIGCDLEQIEPVGDRDSLSGFWTQKDPPADSPTRVEAYSWGNLARTSPSSSFLKGVGRVFGQAFWFLVVPFALANAAYWARRLPAPGSGSRTLAAGAGAGTVRLFALLLSLVFTTTFCALAFGLFAVECFPATGIGQPTAMCKQLPEALDFMTGWSRGQRLALSALVPMAAILAVFVTARLATVRNLAPARVRWNEETGTTEGASQASRGGPFLASPGLWTRPHVSTVTGRAHIAACLALICILLLSDSIGSFWPRNCQTALRMLSGDCIEQLGTAMGQDVLAAPLLGLAIVLLLASMVTVAFFYPEVRAPWEDEVGNKWSNVLWIGGVGLVLATAGQLILVPTPDVVPSLPFAGTWVASLLLLTALVVLGVSGLFMRSGPAFRFATAGGSVSSAVLIVWAAGMVDDWVLAIPAIITVGFIIYYFGLQAGDKAKLEGWHGRGPGIFMFAAILTSHFLSSALVLGTRKFLQWPMDEELPARPEELWRGAGGSKVDLDELLEVPAIYGVTGGLLLFGIALALVGFVPACAWLILKRGLLPMQPPTQTGPGTRPVQPPSYFSDIDVDPLLPDEGPGPERRNLTYRRRRLSALTQRGEAAFGLLTVLIWLAAVLAIAACAFWNGAGATGYRALLLGPLRAIQGDFAGWGIVLAATLILAFMVLNAATSKEERPLAILWDVMCFLPNAAHPFGAPSYSNRVVPELARRIYDWLQAPAPAQAQANAGPNHTVLVSAHSLGAVVAVAAIFHLKACQPELDFKRIRLLTYGVQLRPYFGRFFPELFGPDVLGNCPTRGPGLISIDPWKKAREKETALPGSASLTLLDLLRDGQATSPVWRNIWRRTDYLGFPAYSHCERGNDLDVYAVETEPQRSQFAVATHGNYTATTTYAKVRGEMLADWPG
ncbi:hypothetical protein [Pseudarthrobacter sulfonivorans]|uniref:hypothetical protein n=1 Tax=Pseudarthrobacter sulfonivorans TaxID=121292 RepID=UPI0028545B28|nr:hypothetical protein [Pseudarthrobacter sulfonivorans]MDR6413642.1 hypothetical protein [Pseudarthrobacter sulfonivorans]